MKVWWTRTRQLIGVDELVLALGLVLTSIGCWQAWRPGAFLIPGLVLVWISLPARHGFLLRSPDPDRTKRRSS